MTPRSPSNCPKPNHAKSKPALTVSVTGPNGPAAVPVKTLAVGRPSFTNSADVPKAIPDADNAGVDSTLTLPGAGNVSDLDVRIGSLRTPTSGTWRSR